MSQYTTPTPTGDSRIDAILNGDIARWNAASPVGTPTVVTYSFMQSASDYYEGRVQGFQPFNAVMQDSARQTLAYVSERARIDFVEVPSGGQMRFGTLTQITGFGSPSDQGLGWAPNVGFGNWEGDIWINNTAGMGLLNPVGTENHGGLVLAHEILHALGLKHADAMSSYDAPPFLTGSEDTTDNTIMAQNGPNWTRPQAYDVAALQWLYGPRSAMTIGRLVAGDDAGNVLSGDAANNIIQGYDGADSLTGGDGDDMLVCGAGNDFANGNLGSDTLNGNGGDDTVRGGQGDDSVRGGQGSDRVYGDLGNDRVFADIGNDTVYGGKGNDTIHGGQGDDLISGDLGDDQLWGDKDNDILTGAGGADVFCFVLGSGADTVADFNVADGDRLQIAAGLSTSLTANGAGDAVIFISGDDSITLTGVKKEDFSVAWIVTA